MKDVKFIQDWQDTYEAGHVVTLDDKLADKLIADGICKPYRSGIRPVTVRTTSNGGAS